MEQQGGLPPGFRFSPTDEELVAYYLKNKVYGKSFHNGVIADLDIYKYEPWELSGMSVLDSKDPVWYFFNARDQKHSRTARINRTTNKGYWKATGKDRKVCTGSQTVGVKKTLIYYEGRAPTGIRTDWLMHEYKLIEDVEKKGDTGFAPTLCRIRKKSGPGPRNGEQYGAPVTSEDSEIEQIFGSSIEEIEEKLPEPRDNGDSSTTFVDPSKGYGDHGPIDHDLDMDAIIKLMFPEDGNSHDVTKPYEDNMIFPPGDNALQDPLTHLDGNDLHEFLHPDLYEAGMLSILKNNDGGMGVCGKMDGDYIEMFDIKSPSDGFMPRLPMQNFDLFQPQPFLSYGNDEWLAENVLSIQKAEAAATSIQGTTSRRMRLQVPVASYGQTKENDVPDGNVKLELEEDLVSRPPYIYGQNMAHPSSGGCRNQSSTTSFLSKHRSSYSVSLHGEAPPQVYYSLKEDSVTTNGNASTSLKDETDEVTTRFRSCGINEESYGISGEPYKIKGESNGLNEESTTEDCEANLLTCLHHDELDTKHLKSSWRSKLTTFVSKAKSSSIGTRLKRIEDRVSSRFNERVSRFGKKASQFFSTEDSINPYYLMRKGLVSLLSLLGAILVILLVYLVFHVFTIAIFI